MFNHRAFAGDKEDRDEHGMAFQNCTKDGSLQGDAFFKDLLHVFQAAFTRGQKDD